MRASVPRSLSRQLQTTTRSHAARATSACCTTSASYLLNAVSSSSRSMNASSARTHSTSSSPSSFTTINDSEIDHFTRLSSEWWSETGEFALLHRMNPARIQFIRDFITRDPRHYTSTEEGRPEWTFATRHGAADVDESGEMDSATGTGTGRWLAGMRCLDVGCGGGLLSEALTRLGGDVVGVDAGRENIAMARLHASGDPALPFTQSVQGEQLQGEVMDRIRNSRKGTLEYRHSTAEALRDAGEKFDVVCAMEVLEHVDQPGEFMKCLGDMVKPGGYLIMSTISRTALSQLLTITLAEHALRLVTPGTHTWSKYVKPEELSRFVYTNMGGFDVWEKSGDWLLGGAGGLNEDVGLPRQMDSPTEDARGVGETQGIVYVPWRGQWVLMPKQEGSWGKMLGERCNYMYGARKRADAAR